MDVLIVKLLMKDDIKFYYLNAYYCKKYIKFIYDVYNK